MTQSLMGRTQRLPSAIEDLVVSKRFQGTLPSCRSHGIRISAKQAHELSHLAGTEIALRSRTEQNDRAVQRYPCGRHERRHARLVDGLRHGNNVLCERLDFKLSASSAASLESAHTCVTERVRWLRRSRFPPKQFAEIAPGGAISRLFRVKSASSQAFWGGELEFPVSLRLNAL